MEVVSLTKDNFREHIDYGITFVDFYKPDCDACREQIAITEELAEELRHIAAAGNMDIRQEKEIAAEYRVNSAPTVILFKDGYQVETLVGLQSKEELRKIILRYAAIGDTC